MDIEASVDLGLKSGLNIYSILGLDMLSSLDLDI